MWYLVIILFDEVPSGLNFYRISSVIRGFSFQNNAKNLDPSYKMALDLRDCLGRKGKILITAKFHMTDLVIRGHSREGKTPSYSRINTVFNELSI